VAGGGSAKFAVAAVVLLAAATAGAVLLGRRGEPTIAVVTSRPVPPTPPPPPPAVAATREACLAFLRGQAAPSHVSGTGARPGQVFTQVRVAALEALASLPGAAAAPELLEALGGDGDPEDFAEERLVAARLRIAAKQPDGAETLRRYLDLLSSEDAIFDDDAAAAAAEAAAALAGEPGRAALARLLSAPDEFMDESLARALRAAASLGGGASPEALKALLVDEEEDWEDLVAGAAAGALLRLGDRSGEVALAAALAEEAEVDAEEFARGLAATGNATVLPWLERLLACEDPSARSQAARAAGVVGDRAAVPALVAALGDDDTDVRADAAVALAALGAPEGRNGARAAAEKSADSDLRARAWRVLGDVGDAGALDAAARLLAAPAPPQGDPRREGALLERVWAARLVALLR